MRVITGGLWRVWLGNTVGIGLALLVLGVWQGFETKAFTLGLIVAGVLELALTRWCVRSWWAFAEYKWFWWKL